MAADCHIHMVLDGADYKAALARHRPAADEAWVRRTLAGYRDAGFTFLRDGGDAPGACRLAARLAPAYGIDYRSPAFPIHKVGHYGGFIGRGFSDFAGYRALVDEARALGADFIKVMVAGLMDFRRFGVVTDTPLPAGEMRDMVAYAHDCGLAVMAHVNGAQAVKDALAAGVDSVEHGAYQDDEGLHQLAESGAVWVPTAVTIANLRGRGRYPEDQVARILERQLRSVAAAARYGARIAAGSDAGAWQVFHGRGGLEEAALLGGVLGPDGPAILADGLAEIRRRFRRA